MMPHEHNTGNDAPQPLGRELVSKQRAAEYLGVTERSVENFIARGQLPAYKLAGNLVRIRRDDLEALLVPIRGGKR